MIKKKYYNLIINNLIQYKFILKIFKQKKFYYLFFDN